MATVTIPAPSVPADWHSTLLGLIGAIGLLLKQYTATGTFTYETVAVAGFVAVVCYFIPAKTGPADQAKIVDTVTGIVNSTLAGKIPAAMTTPQTVNGVESAVVDAAAAQAQPAV